MFQYHWNIKLPTLAFFRVLSWIGGALKVFPQAIQLPGLGGPFPAVPADAGAAPIAASPLRAAPLAHGRILACIRAAHSASTALMSAFEASISPSKL